MNTNTRSILSAATGFGLAAFTATSAFIAGASASVTLYAFGLLTAYAMINILVLSYAPRRSLAGNTRRFVPVASVPVHARTVVRVPAVVEYPQCPARAEAA